MTRAARTEVLAQRPQEQDAVHLDEGPVPPPGPEIGQRSTGQRRQEHGRHVKAQRVKEPRQHLAHAEVDRAQQSQNRRPAREVAVQPGASHASDATAAIPKDEAGRAAKQAARILLLLFLAQVESAPRAKRRQVDAGPRAKI
jgi:hypothetical protein